MQPHQPFYQRPSQVPQSLRWFASVGLAISVVANMLASGVASAQTAAPATPATPQYFSDCAHLLFDNRQREVLTRQERVLLLDGQVKSNLNNYESCIQQALNASRERASALAPAINQASAAATNEQGASSETAEHEASETDSTTPMQTQPPTAPSRQVQRGNRQSGSSSVCDAIKSGLENASNESEKQHFAALAKEYNC